MVPAIETPAPPADATGDGEPPFAIVVVHTGLHHRVSGADGAMDDEDDSSHRTRAFHYDIPETLRASVRLGQLVWVPFGKRYLQGIVVGFDHHSPVEQTRPLGQIVDLDPVLSPVHIDLARWISEYYLTPIHQVVLAMLPPGVTQQVDVVVEEAPHAAPGNMTEAQARVLGVIRAGGLLTLQQVARRAKHRGYRAVVDQLVHHGWVTKRVRVRPPSVRPKLVAVVRAVPGAALDDEALERAPRQQQALAYLVARRDRGEEWVALSEAVSRSGAAASAVRALVDKGLAQEGRRQVWRDPLPDGGFVPDEPPTLTPDQEEVWRVIDRDLDEAAGRPFLLQGVTGSGKTEIYLRAVQRVLQQGRSAIVLVPEIALTPQTIRRFGARFPSTLAVWHSRLSLGERYDQWQRMRAGDLCLVVGSRSAIFAPVRDLGLVILDEEHESSYKQGMSPRYHARDVAVHLALQCGATCLLGSATPALESAYRAEQGAWVHLRMPRRVMGHRKVLEQQVQRAGSAGGRYQALLEGPQDALFAELPPVQVVDMRAELRSGNRSIFSAALRRAMDVALAAGEQIILFLNRRGDATFVMCRDCGHVLKCPQCEVPLTYHSAVDDLICHHCNYTTFVPPQCPSCWSGRIKFFGIGTQRVERIVQEQYPQARVVRWDLDTTGGRQGHERLLDRFIRGEADIMVGTQMIAKGLDLPRVTLVGVITADTMINLPELSAGERTFQLLTQVAGRAGRSVLGGRVIIQTYTPHHPAVQAARTHDYDGFYRQEIAFRRKHWYPPLSQLIRLLYVGSSQDGARRHAEGLHRALTLRIARLGIEEIGLIGPTPAFFARLRGKWRWQIIVRGKEPRRLLVDMRLPLGWRIDVDPVSLL